MRTSLASLALIAALAMSLAGCDRSSSPPPGAGPGAKKIVIGLVAKSQSNPVFQAAYVGAKDAAKELGPKYNAQVVIDWQTPDSEDATKQAAAIGQLSTGGAAGIAVACSDANVLTGAIDKAVERGVVVMCFDSDAPASKRLCYYGTDDIDCGRKVMDQLAQEMGKKGTIAMLAGSATAPNLQKRADGVKEALKAYPDMKLLENGVIYLDKEVNELAAEAVNKTQTANPSIEGWAFIGGWPLFVKSALKWPPGSVKVVSVDALPAELGYLESGHVQVLYGQDCYGWGYKSVEILLEKIVNKKDPATPRIIAPLTAVTKDNARDWAKKWEKWEGK